MARMLLSGFLLLAVSAVAFAGTQQFDDSSFDVVSEFHEDHPMKTSEQMHEDASDEEFEGYGLFALSRGGGIYAGKCKSNGQCIQKCFEKFGKAGQCVMKRCFCWK